MVLAGLSTLVPAMAQNAADPPRLRARVANPAIKNGRPTDIFILSANGPMVQFVKHGNPRTFFNRLPARSGRCTFLKRMISSTRR